MRMSAICRRYNWYSLEVQMDSLNKLKQVDFLHALPGHGRRMSFRDAVAKDEYIDLTVMSTKQDSSANGTGCNVVDRAPQPISTTN